MEANIERGLQVNALVQTVTTTVADSSAPLAMYGSSILRKMER